MEKKLLNKLLQESEKTMSKDKMFHDFAHAKNVFKNAKMLIEKLGGDETVILTAALFHDIARDSDSHEQKGAELLNSILSNIEEFPKDKIEETCLAVLHHEDGQKTLNEKIVADADKIDAFSVLGIGRGFMMLAIKESTLKEGISLYLELLDKWYKNFHFEESRKIAKKDYDSTKEILLSMLSMY